MCSYFLSDYDHSLDEELTNLPTIYSNETEFIITSVNINLLLQTSNAIMVCIITK